MAEGVRHGRIGAKVPQQHVVKKPEALPRNDAPLVTFDKYFEASGFQPYGQTKEGKNLFPASVGTVSENDTAQFRLYLEEFKSYFPGDAVFVYGTPSKDKKGKSSDRIPVYALRTYNLSLIHI